MNEKFAVFQWKLLTFTTWKDQIYSYRNLEDRTVTMSFPYEGINDRHVIFKLVLLG